MDNIFAELDRVIAEPQKYDDLPGLISGLEQRLDQLRAGGEWKQVRSRPPRPVHRAHFTAALSLPVRVVTLLDQVKQDGNLYYVQSCEHLAVNIAGRLFHGWIGRVLGRGDLPHKIKDCKFGIRCTRRTDCDYYHDPAVFSDSRDRRNWIGGSEFGSIDTIDVDIMHLTQDKISQLHDKAMHYILCALVVDEAMRK